MIFTYVKSIGQMSQVRRLFLDIVVPISKSSVQWNEWDKHLSDLALNSGSEVSSIDVWRIEAQFSCV